MKFRILSVKDCDDAFKLQYKKGFFSRWETLKNLDNPMWNEITRIKEYDDKIFFSVEDAEDFLERIDFRAYFYRPSKKEKVVKKFEIPYKEPK